MQIRGFTLVRMLSDRERSTVDLARDSSGALRAVKLQKPRDPSHLADLVARDERLELLTRQTGLLPILARGVTEDGWTWKCFPLADNLGGLPPLTDEAGLQQYTPLTLRAQSLEYGPTTAESVARWGVRLADALAVLHGAGLVHRDVKPANILFVGREPFLGDYGLVGKPGDKIEFNGTEGFRPLEGTNEIGADLFALGKTLYETWTAKDRLEYPSMPRSALDEPDWNVRGSHLNQILLRACHAQPRKRFQSAEEFSKALSQVVSGLPPLNRRRWLLVGAAVAGAGVAVELLRTIRHPPPRLVWRRVRRQGFNAELWQGHHGMVDWERERIYSISVGLEGCVLQSLDLKRFSLETKHLPDGPKYGCGSILHPHTRKLWAIERHQGEVFALDVEKGKFTRLGGGPGSTRHHEGRTYWNPVTRRVGVFGGYGEFAVTNERNEFDTVAGRWVQMEPDREGLGPCRRSPGLGLVVGRTGQKIYAVGGYGSPSGKQGERAPGLKGFDGRFHHLDDIWELDLAQNSWRCLLPPGHLDPQRLRAAMYSSPLQGLVILEGIKLGDNAWHSAGAWLLRPGIDRSPVRLAIEGDNSHLATVWSWTFDPNNGELVVLADDGIFRVSTES